MVWNSTWPDGTISVRANRTKGNQNTTYVGDTMGNVAVGTNATTTTDHFWGIDSNLDGHHRFIKSPAFTVGGSPDDPAIGTGIDGCLYLKTTNSTAQVFYKNATTPTVPYQVTPTVLTGSTAINISSYVNIVAIPANVYGEIFIYNPTTHSDQGTQIGFFRSDGTTTQAWPIGYKVTSNSADVNYAVQFGNGANASGLNIRGKITASGAPTSAWTYIVTYRAL